MVLRGFILCFLRGYLKSSLQSVSTKIAENFPSFFNKSRSNAFLLINLILSEQLNNLAFFLAEEILFLEISKKHNLLTNGYYIDIGREITELLKSKELKNIEDFESSYIEILEDIIKNRQPAIITNHLVFRINDKLKYYEKLENLAIPKGYIHISSEPKDILRRHINNLEGRIRKIEDLKSISTHQSIEYNITYRLAKKYEVGFLSIFNTQEDVEENFSKIKEFIVTSLEK